MVITQLGHFIYDKLMQSYRPQAKFCFKSYLNLNFIDYLKPNLNLNCRHEIDFSSWKNLSILIEKQSIYIKNG